MFNIKISVCSIKDVPVKHLVAYGDGSKFAIKFQHPTENLPGLLVYSLSEMKVLSCLDDYEEEIPGFNRVIYYGKDYIISLDGDQKLISHINELDPGAVAIKGAKLYFAHTTSTSESKASRGFCIEDCKSIHGDTIGYGLGSFTQWSVKIPAVGAENGYLKLLGIVAKPRTTR